MGSRDKFKKEQKKPKKDAKRPTTASIFEPVSEVEVIKKKHKKDEFPE
jgi:hypothetical protein